MSTSLADSIRSMAPQLVVTDLERSIRFYTEQLGFILSFRHEDVYAGLECAGHSLHLKVGSPSREERERKRMNEDLDLSFIVRDLDGIYELLLSRKVDVVQPLRAMPYGREFYIADPDGYLFAFMESAA